ncbi:MAG: enoyl-CoA hydratase/isomerase family protein [Bdellovibrionales bacterium]|nr:enoyl-CoA hydratase/isomerase family protein [Bdellovibrionales bacterium]
MQNILIHEEENVLNVSLNRPEKKNALDLKTIQSLTQVFLNKPSKTVLLKGEGSCFCAGADLGWISSAPSEELECLFQLFETVQSAEVPVLVYVHGFVYGGGIGLLSACDFIFAEHSTKFCFSELKLGLMPALIAPFILQRSPQMKEYMLNGKLFSAQEALKLNLIHFTGSTEEFKNWQTDQVDCLGKLHQGAFHETKKFLKDLPFVSKENIKQFCIQSLQQRRKDPFVKDMIKKFLSKEIS